MLIKKIKILKKDNEQTLSEAIQGMVKKYYLSESLCESKLITSWENIMGKIIDKHTENLSLRRNILYVTLNSAALRQELSMAKQKIIALLNKEIGEDFIKDVVFK